MKIIYWNQPEEVKLGDMLLQRLSEDFDQVWIVSGFTKDSGIEDLLPAIENSKIHKKNMDLGIDKKNTSKDMLLKLLQAGVTLRIFLNRVEEKVETRIYAFIKKNGISSVYLSAGKLSSGGLFENYCLITEIIYTPEESKELEVLLEKLKKDKNFKPAKKEDIVKLGESGEIMTRITERKIPKISELYQKDGVEIGVKQYDESVGTGVANPVYEDIDIDVDLPKE